MTGDRATLIAEAPIPNAQVLATVLHATERGTYDGRRVWDTTYTGHPLTIIGEG